MEYVLLMTTMWFGLLIVCGLLERVAEEPPIFQEPTPDEDFDF
jgi:hypothetical protein